MVNIIEISSSEEEDNYKEIDVVKYPIGRIENYVYKIKIPNEFKIRNNIFYISDLSRLLPGTWLNDKIINFYFELLSETFVDTYFFNTFTYSRIVQTYSKEDLRKQYDEINFERYNSFIFPIHTMSHWSLVKIDRKRIIGFDSLGTVPYRVLRNIKWFYLNVILNSDDHSENSIPLKLDCNCPKQENMDDCGVFCCMYAKYYSSANDVTQFASFDIRKMRFKMIHEILAGKIMYF